MTNNTIIPHDHHHHHRLRPHHPHQEMDHQLQQLQALAVKKKPPAQAAKRPQQARRRTHTSRPYQERLLNMAEARREIVTALKIHRATTTTTTRQQHQQSTHHHHHHHHEPPPFSAQLQQQQEEASPPNTTTTTTMSYAAASASFADPLCNFPPAHSWIAAGTSYCWSPVPILHLPCKPEPELPPTADAMGGLEELEHYQHQYHGGLELERLVRSLPAQPLGLNLSFQGFGVSVDDDGARASNSKYDDCEDLLVGLPSTTTTQPSPAAVETAATAHAHAYGGHGYGSPELISSATDEETHSSALVVPAVVLNLDGGGETTMAQASTNGGEMQMQGVAECWSEAAAADVAAWWSKIFGSGDHAPRPNAEDDVVAEPGLPAWRLCGGDDDVGAVGEQQRGAADVLGTTVMHRDDGEHEEVTLPCNTGMDDGIGDDTEGWDGEWFSYALES